MLEATSRMAVLAKGVSCCLPSSRGLWLSMLQSMPSLLGPNDENGFTDLLLIHLLRQDPAQFPMPTWPQWSIWMPTP